MKPIGLANQYMKIFYSGKKLERLYDIFEPDLEFIGPFYRFHTSEEYVESLKKSPPKNMKYTIIQEYHNECSACLVYTFIKENVSTIMAQVFEVRDEKISKIILIFDSRQFS